MALRSWLQKNQVFDRDLMVLFPKYGVNDPPIDLKTLSKEKWDELKLRLMTDRAAELKDGAARNRLQKKLTKVEKLWKEINAPPKKEKKKKKTKKTKKTSTKTFVKPSDSAENDQKTENSENEANNDAKYKKLEEEYIELKQFNIKIKENYEGKLKNKQEKYNKLKTELVQIKNSDIYNEKPSDIKQELIDLKSKYDTLNTEHIALKKKQIEFEEYRKNTEEKYDVLFKEYAQFKQQLSTSSSDEITVLNDKMKALQQDIHEKQTKYDVLCKEYDEFKQNASKSDEKQDIIDLLQSENEKLDENATELKKELRSMKEGKSKHKLRISDLKQELDSFKNELQSIHTLKFETEEHLKSEIETQHNDYHALKKQYTELKSEQKVKYDIADSDLSDKLLKLEVEMEDLHETNDKLKKNIRDLSKTNKSATKDSDKKYERLRKEFEEFKQRTEHELSSFEDNEIVLNDEITALKLVNNKTKTGMKRLQNKYSILKDNLEEKEDEMSELQVRYDDIKDCTDAIPLNVDKIVAQNENEKLKQRHKTMEQKFKKKAVQYSGLLKEYNAFIEEQNEDNESTQKQIESLKNELKEEKVKYDGIQKEYDVLVLKKERSELKLEAGNSEQRRSRKIKPHRKSGNKHAAHHMGVLSAAEYDEYMIDDDIDIRAPVRSDGSENNEEKDTFDEDVDTFDKQRLKPRKRKFKPSLKRKQKRPQSARSKLSQSKSRYTSDTGVYFDSNQ